jgi:colicin import membrane protein
MMAGRGVPPLIRPAIRPLVRRLSVFTGILGAVLLMHGCASAPGTGVFNIMDPAAIHDREQAQAAIAAAAAARERLQPQWRQREHDCYARFFVTACLDKLGSERREVEYRLRRVEIRARMVLREAQIQIEVRDEARQLDGKRQP